MCKNNLEEFEKRVQAVKGVNPYSLLAMKNEDTRCIFCGGYLILTENGDFECEDCGRSVLEAYAMQYEEFKKRR